MGRSDRTSGSALILSAVIAFCDHELSDRIPKIMREPALIKSNEFAEWSRNVSGSPA